MSSETAPPSDSAHGPSPASLAREQTGLTQIPRERLAVIAGWIDALAHGHDELRAAVVKAAQYLHAANVEQIGGGVHPSSEQIWGEIGDTPVPPAGEPGRGRNHLYLT